MNWDRKVLYHLKGWCVLNCVSTCGSGTHLPDEGDRAVRDDLRATRPDGGGTHGGWQEQEHRRPQRSPHQSQGNKYA